MLSFMVMPYVFTFAKSVYKCMFAHLLKFSLPRGSVIFFILLNALVSSIYWSLSTKLGMAEHSQLCSLAKQKTFFSFKMLKRLKPHQVVRVNYFI